MPVRDFIQDVLNGESRVPANCERQYIMAVLARLKGAARDSTHGKPFSTITDLRGSPYPELSKNRFFLFQSMNLLSENIVAKFYSPYRNSFDGRVPSSGLRGASGMFFSPSENFKARFLETTFFKIACTIEGEPIKLLL